MSSIDEDWQTMAENRARRQYANATAWDHSPRSNNVVLARMRDELGSEFDAFITKIKADAWDEGYAAGTDDTTGQISGQTLAALTRETPNPHR